jgi:hypothetical protein
MSARMRNMRSMADATIMTAPNDRRITGGLLLLLSRP